MFFESQLALLGLTTAATSVSQRWYGKQTADINSTNGEEDSAEAQTGSTLANDYLIVYCLFMAADWLQGPYMFRLLHTEHRFATGDVATLFVIGFLSAAAASPIVGRLADLYGRRALCIAACVLYSIDCLMICLPSWTACVIARICGGAATSILWSVPESWLVSSAHANSLSQTRLSGIFGTAAFLNGVVAVLAGIVSNTLVSYTDTAKSPFRLAVVMLCLTAAAITAKWEENKGQPAESGAGSVRNAIRAILTDSNLCAILLAQSIFETSMYNFVFAWVPAMDELASKVRHAAAENLPLGIIFASFMCSMMLGSLLYGYVVRRAAGTAQYLPVPTTSDDQVNSYRPLALHGRMATVLLAGAGMALGVANASPFLQAQFWGFCLFEFTVGLYFPVMGWLKSELVHDDVRATFASLFRLPLNIMVSCSLLLGAEEHRTQVFQTATVGLILTALVIFYLLGQKHGQHGSLGQNSSQVTLKM